VHKVGQNDVVQKSTQISENKLVFAVEVIFERCRVYSLSSRMRDVKAVYPTQSKA